MDLLNGIFGPRIVLNGKNSDPSGPRIFPNGNNSDLLDPVSSKSSQRYLDTYDHNKVTKIYFKHKKLGTHFVWKAIANEYNAQLGPSDIYFGSELLSSRYFNTNQKLKNRGLPVPKPPIKKILLKGKPNPAPIIQIRSPDANPGTLISYPVSSSDLGTLVSKPKCSSATDSDSNSGFDSESDIIDPPDPNFPGLNAL